METALKAFTVEIENCKGEIDTATVYAYTASAARRKGTQLPAVMNGDTIVAVYPSN